MTRNMAQTMPAGGAGAPVVPLGQTTVLSSDDLMRIKTTLLHADAKSTGTQIKSEVETLPHLPMLYPLAATAAPLACTLPCVLLTYHSSYGRMRW
jgi:hypothetical protein